MFSPPSYSPSESSDPLEKSLLQFFSLQSRLLVHCGNFNLNHESMPWARHAGFGQDLLRRILNHKERPLEADDAQHYLQGIFRHLLKDSAVVMVPEASLGPLSLQDEATEHLTYRLMKTPCNRIEWDVDLMDSQHLCVTEIEELALGSDIIWSMRRQGHELDEQKASKLLNTVRLLLPVASKVSHDPEDEYLTELFQEDACYFEEHGCYPPDF
ncbi:unnamed protein product [Cladocopium goreaui]|uniref:Uncharacterized protein n=2 Tax=Cladocopium goreaui TaxID=2562237 RepID=A0A9P1CX00_9DINO|nr:unnamed protein product [Cladocopium goreaui]